MFEWQEQLQGKKKSSFGGRELECYENPTETIFPTTMNILRIRHWCKVLVGILLVQISSGHLSKPQSWRETFEETLISHAVLKKHTFESVNNTKHWVSYIKKLAFESLKYVFWISEFVYGMNTFVQMESHHRNILLSWWKVTDFVHSIKQNKTSSIVKLTIGQIFAGADGCHLYHPKPKVRHDCISLSNTVGKSTKDNDFIFFYKWIFKLDHHLRLNITFQHIKILVKNLFTCLVGFVSVQQFTTKHVEHKYCGVLSNIVNCPSFAHFRILLSVKALVTFEMHTAFSVIDSGHIENLLYKTNVSPKPEWAITFTVTKLFCEKFYLQQEKIYRLLVVFSMFNTCWVEIFDGPGRKSQKLIPISTFGNRKSYLTASFQCIVFSYCSSAFPSLFANPKIIFQVKEILVDNFLFVSTKTRLPEPFSFNKSCYTTEVRTEVNFHINTTITSLTSSYKNNELCSFGGIAAYEENSRNKSHIMTLCSQQSYVFKHRNIYSTNNSLLLVTYSCQGYGSVNMTLELSTTTCLRRKIDGCTQPHTVLFSPSDTCFVFQMENDMDAQFYDTRTQQGKASCEEQVTVFNIQGPDWIEIKLHITGYLKGIV